MAQLGEAMSAATKNRVFGALLGLLVSTVVATNPAHAENPQSPSGWSFQITPYLWLAGIGGNVTTREGITASFDQSIGQVLSHLDGGLMVLGEARHGRWMLVGDFDYARLSASRDLASLTTKEFLGTINGGYRFIDSPGFKLDGFIGVRVMSVNNDLSIAGLTFPRSDAASGSWADPLLAVRAVLPIGSGFLAYGYGDFGGGPDSDLTWQIYGGLGYNFNETIAGYVGYRYLSMRHSTDGPSFDLKQQGPLIGVGFRF